MPIAIALSSFGLGCAASPTATPPPAKRAAIVDQLSLTAPNPDFAAEAKAILAQAGYEVDYVPGEQVTVDYYRRLPTQAYDLVVLRVHSARQADGDLLEEDVALFTSQLVDLSRFPVRGMPPAAVTAAAERARASARPPDVAAAPTSDPHSMPRADDLPYLIPVFYDPTQADPPRFGLKPEFITEGLQGDFGGADVIMMGCDGLRANEMARAFTARGAGSFISWTRPVRAPHTDRATLRLLEALVREEQPLPKAIAAAMDDVGPDPLTDAVLVYYPPPPGGFTPTPRPTRRPTPTTQVGHLLAGLVSLGQSQPVAGAVVELYSAFDCAAAPGAPEDRTETADDGTFTFRVMEPGRYMVAAHHEGQCIDRHWRTADYASALDPCAAPALEVMHEHTRANVIVPPDAGCP